MDEETRPNAPEEKIAKIKRFIIDVGVYLRAKSHP
jgi:hypothetical protein